jgi:hypothetical protein
MPTRLILLLCCAVVTGSVASAEIEVDSDFMQNVEDINKSLASDIASHDGRSSVGEASELATLFAQVEAFYTRKGGADDAVDLSHKSRQLSDNIAQQVKAGDFDQATSTATELSRTCKSCHNFYKKS